MITPSWVSRVFFQVFWALKEALLQDRAAPSYGRDAPLPELEPQRPLELSLFLPEFQEKQLKSVPAVPEEAAVGWKEIPSEDVPVPLPKFTD